MGRDRLRWRAIRFHALQVFDFRTIFHVSKTANAFNAINIYLQDSENSDVVVKVSYTEQENGSVRFSVNDSTPSYQTSADFKESNVDDFRLFYNNATRKISYSTELAVVITKDVNGNAFNGFPSGNIYMKVELVGVSGTAGVEFLSINNQTLSKLTRDLIKPEVSMNPIEGERYIDDTVTIKATFAQDVLGPVTRFTMYVKTPSGNYARSKDGIILNDSADPQRDYDVGPERFLTWSSASETENR